MARAVNQQATKVLNTLTEGLTAPGTEGSARKIDNTEGSYMYVAAERIGATVYSVAHYYEQNGDLMADPEMTFLKVDGRYYPISIRMDAIGMRREGLVLDPYTEAIVGIRKREQREEAVFAGTWMTNIRHQQGL